MSHHPDTQYHPSLPPELRAAPLEFGAWSQTQLLNDQRKSTPTKPLYHYTDMDALKGILGTERLWCFSHLHQTDREEFAYSLRVARRVIKAIGRTKDEVTHHFCACLDDMLENNSFTDTFEFYLFSLSRHRDHRQQWRNYGQKGRGFAIGFAPALFQATQSNLNERANENNFVGRVLYGNFATEHRHRRVIERAAKIASRVARTNLSLTRAGIPPSYSVTMAHEVIASQLIWNCLTAKRNKYSDEQEVRYIIMGVCEKFDGLRKVYNGKSYIELPLKFKDQCGIMEVLVGPDAPAGSKEMIREFLKAQGYPDGIPVRRSLVTI
jgi:hypothetical protein